MQILPFSLSALPKKIVAVSTLLGVSLAFSIYTIAFAPRSNSAWDYRFQRPPVGSVTQNIQKEIAFHQQNIQRQPTAGLERAALAQSYVKMARATGDSSWYLLAEQTAQQSIEQLSVDNHGAIVVLAQVAVAKHDFGQALSLLKQLPPQVESGTSLLITTKLAVGDIATARSLVDAVVQRTPTLGNLTLKAMVEVAQGEDQAALRDFQAALAAEEPGEAGSSAWVRTLLGRLYYQRGQLQKAEELYQSALQILPKYPPALLNLAELSVRRWQDDPTRRADQQRATELYSQFFLTSQKAPMVYDHVALRGLARLQRLQGNSAQALQTWQTAVTRLRSDIEGFGHRRELAQLLLERGTGGDREEALQLMQAEVKNRQDAETWATLASAHLQLGQFPAAEQAMQQALKSGRRDPGLLDRAATIATAQGQVTLAQTYQQQVQSIDPSFGAGARAALGLGIGLNSVAITLS
jgi:tetratricopeptide (TPR) repeat protein